MEVEVSVLEVSDVSHASIFGSFHAGIYDYYVIHLGSSRDGAINWCKNNLDAVLPLPCPEYEYEVNASPGNCVKFFLRNCTKPFHKSHMLGVTNDHIGSQFSSVQSLIQGKGWVGFCGWG